MYVCMKSKYTDLDYTKCQMASMLYFLWWEIHFYVVGLVRLAFLDQRSVAKLVIDVCMYVCMKSKYTDLDYTKCQMASMLYFLWWEIHFYVVGLVRLAFLDQRSVAKLMVLVDHREFVSVLNLCCEEFCES